MKCGLLPLSQEACLIGDVSYHSYNGIVIDPAERESLAKDLGPNNKVMFLRNHGVVCCGSSIEEAFHVCCNTVLACDTQMKMIPIGLDNLVMIDDETRRRTFEIGQRGGGGVNSSKKEWGVGEMEFEAQMRMLDNSGYRTGFAYVQPLERKEPARLADGGGRALQGLAPQGPPRPDGQVRQGRQEGQVGELAKCLPEGGGAGDRHHRPKEDHQGNPDPVRQSRQKEVNCMNRFIKTEFSWFMQTKVSRYMMGPCTVQTSVR